MKLFQIVTSDGEFNGKFDIKFSEDMNFGEGSDIDFDDESLIEKWEILYCCGDQWCEENLTNIDEEIIKKELFLIRDKVYWTVKQDDYLIKIIDDEVVKNRIFIRKADREIYESIKKSEGDLKGSSNMELFLIAMMLGYNKKGKQGLKGVNSTATDGFVRIASFPEDAWYVIKSIAVYEEEYIEVLLSNNKMFDIAEKYAIVGIQELEKLYFENEHNFLKRMEKLLIDEFDVQRIKNDIVVEEVVE